MQFAISVFEFSLILFPKKLKSIIRHAIYGFIVKKIAKSIKGSLKVNKFSIVNKNSTLGDNVNFNGLKITGNGKVSFGNHFHSGRNCLLITSFHNYNGTKIPYDETTIVKNITIEDCVWLGDNVTILGGVTIGEGAIIQTGSVVTKNIPPLSIAGGHPAAVFKKRDEVHYSKLKNEKSFF